MEVSRFVLFTLLTLLILSQSQRRRRVRQKKKGLVRNRELEDENAGRKRIKRICRPKENTLAVNRELEDLKEMRTQMDHMREEIDDMKQNLISLGTTSLGPGDFPLGAKLTALQTTDMLKQIIAT